MTGGARSGRARMGRSRMSWLVALLLVGVAGAPALAQEAPAERAPDAAATASNALVDAGVLIDDIAPTEPSGAAPAATASTPPATAPLSLPFAASPELEAVGRRIGRLPGGTREKADAIVRFIFLDPDGLRFEYQRYPTLTADQAFRARTGNCLSLVNLFIALARSAGLDAFPVEVEDWAVFSRRDGAVVRSTHVVGGLNVGNYAALGQLWTIDFLPEREKSYRKLARIGDGRHAALHYNSVAVEAMLAGDLETAERLFDHALALDRKSAEAWSNYAVLARRGGDLEAGFERLEAALAVDRHFLPALNNMASFHRLAGRPQVAEGYERKALEAKLQNPYFLIDQAIRRLQRDELDAAYDLLVRARRIDKTIPETYVVLGRVDLARGRVARAERNFAAARERSQQLSPDFQEGLDRKIGKLLHLASN
jgi:Tfp pilus assembly protein PilF